MSDSISGQCHCGAVQLSAPPPEYVTECNCTMCTKLAGLWFYHPGDRVTVTGETVPYIRSDLSETFLATHHCPRCGCTTHWRPLTGEPDARMGLNVRMFDESVLEGVERRLCDGRSWPF